jgi:3-hydroxyisobutyrate dehydrogenase
MGSDRHGGLTAGLFENRGPHILSGDFTPLSAVGIFVKDLRLLDTARKRSLPLPLSATAHQMFLSASAAGREDDSAVIKIFPGITLPERKD